MSCQDVRWSSERTLGEAGRKSERVRNLGLAILSVAAFAVAVGLYLFHFE
jgi:hypothetical protein